MMMNFSERFIEYGNTFKATYSEEIERENNFTPQYIGNKVRLLAGVDGGRYAIALRNDDKKTSFDISSTSLIQVKKYYDKKSNYEAIIFSLTDESLLSIFISFAIDLEVLISSDKDVTLSQLYNRYLYWLKMFKQERQNISIDKIYGLLHELYIIYKFMAPKYGIAESLKGWGGPDSNNKDFAFSDGMWYEVKAVNSGKKTIRISSIEQLESENVGILLITEFEKTSSVDKHGLNLLYVFNKVMGEINTEIEKSELLGKIISIGIEPTELFDENSEMNNNKWIAKESSYYKVNESFPRLSKAELPKAMGAVSYELILTEIDGFKTEFF